MDVRRRRLGPLGSVLSLGPVLGLAAALSSAALWAPPARAKGVPCRYIQGSQCELRAACPRGGLSGFLKAGVERCRSFEPGCRAPYSMACKDVPRSVFVARGTRLSSLVFNVQDGVGRVTRTVVLEDPPGGVSSHDPSSWRDGWAGRRLAEMGIDLGTVVPDEYFHRLDESTVVYRDAQGRLPLRLPPQEPGISHCEYLEPPVAIKSLATGGGSFCYGSVRCRRAGGDPWLRGRVACGGTGGDGCPDPMDCALDGEVGLKEAASMGAPPPSGAPAAPGGGRPRESEGR